MLSAWSDADARAAVAHYTARYAGCNEDLALRVYSSRLIGREPGLVLRPRRCVRAAVTEGAANSGPTPVVSAFSAPRSLTPQASTPCVTMRADLPGGRAAA